MLVLSCNLF